MQNELQLSSVLIAGDTRRDQRKNEFFIQGPCVRLCVCVPHSGTTLGQNSAIMGTFWQNLLLKLTVKYPSTP